MQKVYSQYFWKKGVPQGIPPSLSFIKAAKTDGDAYKIVCDPYHKRISLEKYRNGHFIKIVYDSALLDFRYLSTAEQNAWQKTVIGETEDEMICHIRDQNDRLLLIENYRFEKQFCRECRIHSPHGILLAIHKVFYEFLNDPFNGVILYDTNEHPVIFKSYQIDPISQEFTQLLKEQSDMEITGFPRL